jgi:hypothetical protein
MQLAFLAPATSAESAPPLRTAGAWWYDAPRRRDPDEPWLDELRDPSLVPPEIRRAAVAWYARVEPTPVHRA